MVSRTSSLKSGRTSSLKSDGLRLSRSQSGPRPGCSKTKSSNSGASTMSRASRHQGRSRSPGSTSDHRNSGDETNNRSGGRRSSLKRGCSFKGSYRDKNKGQKLMRDRFLKDGEIEQARKKKALQDMRSNGVRSKCNQLVTFSQKSGYKVSATFLPNWDRGVPHVVLSENWEDTDSPLKPLIKKTYVKNWDNVQKFSVEEEDETASFHGGSIRRSARIGSPNQIRPMAKARPKGKSAPEIKCTVCNATYHQDSTKLWMFCGAEQTRGKCKKLAIHASCHFIVADNQKEVDKVCKKHIRCLDCRERERKEKKIKLAEEEKKKQRLAEKKKREKQKKRAASPASSDDFTS